jgi:plasmid stabilization system protein ParE
VKVLFTAEAQEELVATASFYAREASAELGSAFVDEVERACKLLEEAPFIGREWHLQTRRLVLRRFPFNLVYRIAGEVIQVIALAHHRRKPGYWPS